MPEGASLPYLMTLAPDKQLKLDTVGIAFGARILKNWVSGPSGKDSPPIGPTTLARKSVGQDCKQWQDSKPREHSEIWQRKHTNWWLSEPEAPSETLIKPQSSSFVHGSTHRW